MSRRVATVKPTRSEGLRCEWPGCTDHAVAQVGLPKPDAKFACKEHFDEWLAGRTGPRAQ